MLCPSCRRQVNRGAGYCPSCGAALDGGAGAFELVLEDRTRVPVVRDMTIGRAPGNTLQLTDPSVSRVHARISLGGRLGRAPVLEDVRSSHGTWLDGRRIDRAQVLRDGADIRLGNRKLRVERHRTEEEAGRTILVPPGASLVVPTAGRTGLAPATGHPDAHPRLRSGHALKRLAATEGPDRWILKDLANDKLVRLSDADGRLLELLDGRPLSDLVRESERRLGSGGPARLARLLADLDQRGLLAGSAATGTEEREPGGFVQRLVRPRELQWRAAGELFERLYLRGGWVLFTRPALAAIAVLAAVGICVFALLVVGRYGTPFVVANKIGFGGLVFIAGRFAVAAVHETAHGLAMASFGRRVRKAGLKLLLVFPYAYVDTSEIWFEPRRRRIAVSAAGPASDFTLGAAFSLCCFLLPAGTVRDVFFQLAFAAYLGGLFNLNPLLDRDGYQALADLMGEPRLRRRALEQFKRELGGRALPSDAPVLARYSLFALGWWIVTGSFAVGFSLRYEATLASFVPEHVAWALLGLVWTAAFVPALAMIAPPLRVRLRSRSP